MKTTLFKLVYQHPTKSKKGELIVYTQYGRFPLTSYEANSLGDALQILADDEKETYYLECNESLLKEIEF